MYLAVLLLYQTELHRPKPVVPMVNRDDLDVNSEVTLIYDTFFIFNILKRRVKNNKSLIPARSKSPATGPTK
jgi:hypothetical protein